jgi:hypothetical protein
VDILHFYKDTDREHYELRDVTPQGYETLLSGLAAALGSQSCTAKLLAQFNKSKDENWI